MQISVKEENGNLICLKHNQQITMFLMDNQVPFKDALVCQECIQEKPTVSNKIFGMVQVRRMISEKYTGQERKLENEKQTFLESLQSLSNKVLDYKNKVIQQTGIIIDLLSKWITDIKSKIVNLESINLIQELELLHQNIFEVNSDKSILKIDQAHLTKLLNSFQKLIQKKEIEACYEQIKIIEKDIFLSSNQGGKTNKQQESNQTNVPKKGQFINAFQQKEICRAIAFNQAGSLMVAGSESNIKVWSFDKGNINELKTLTGHKDLIYCLVFSKRLNWFVSGSRDSKIRGWREKDNDWVNYEPQKQHSDKVYCVLLNNQENQLLSCGADKKIIVWKVDCQNNKIQNDYILEKHTEAISSISLNFNETALVSCGLDNLIILWTKGLNQKWEYTNQVKVNFGIRLCFVSDTQFLFQPETFSLTQVFQIENKSLIEQRNLEIDLPGVLNDFFLFPTIYNKHRELIIQKHNQYIYIIQRLSYGTFKIVLGPIDCYHKENFGSITEDGQYLVFWNLGTEEFKVIQIFY